jgi:uracil-DNA glycosylase
VTRASGDLLGEELSALEPQVLVAVGGEAARAIDDLRHPLARSTFLDAPEGAWFSWTRGTRGLRLPALAPALADDDAKRRFWRAFLALRTLGEPSGGR